MSSTVSTRRNRAPQSIIPLVQPKWKRSLTLTDVQPSPLNQDDDEICSVCRQCESRYKCPRCQIPYCSVACYKQHDADDTVSCTESFYQDRVSTVLHYEAKEHSKSMQQILTRCHQVTPDEAEEDRAFALDDEQQAAFDKDLLRLAEALETGTLSEQEAERMMTPQLRLRFERELKSGELSALIEPWHAWWLPDFAAEQSKSPSIPDVLVHRKTLDERLLKVPRFSILRAGPLPVLTYNVVDLLYSVALTLRRFHGVDNSVSLCSESCKALIETSAVLRNDARHASVAEALMSCTAVSASAQSCNTVTTPWTVLAQDVMYLCASQRHVSHALLEAIDIVKAEVKVMKSEGDTDGASLIRRIKRKLEYYLSWSREATLSGDLEDDLRAWIDEWSGENDPEIDSLLLPKPVEPGSNPRPRAAKTCGDVVRDMKEISSTRKIQR